MLHHLPFLAIISSKSKDWKGFASVCISSGKERMEHTLNHIGLSERLHDKFFHGLEIWLSCLNRKVSSSPKYF